jgi:hypothetical protein
LTSQIVTVLLDFFSAIRAVASAEQLQERVGGGAFVFSANPDSFAHIPCLTFLPTLPHQVAAPSSGKISMDTVKKMAAEGKSVMVVGDTAYDFSDFLKLHPGGKQTLTLDFMIPWIVSPCVNVAASNPIRNSPLMATDAVDRRHDIVCSQPRCVSDGPTTQNSTSKATPKQMRQSQCSSAGCRRLLD